MGFKESAHLPKHRGWLSSANGPTRPDPCPEALERRGFGLALAPAGQAPLSCQLASGGDQREVSRYAANLSDSVSGRQGQGYGFPRGPECIARLAVLCHQTRHESRAGVPVMRCGGLPQFIGEGAGRQACG